MLAGPGLGRHVQESHAVQGRQPGALLLTLVDLGSGHVLGRVAVDDLVDDGVLVEQVLHAELRRPGGRGQVLVLQGTQPDLHMRATHRQRVDPDVGAPAQPQLEMDSVAVQRLARVAGEEPCAR